MGVLLQVYHFMALSSFVDVILKVPVVNEILDLILEGDAFLSGMTDVLVESAILILVPL